MKSQAMRRQERAAERELMERIAAEFPGSDCQWVGAEVHLWPGGDGPPITARAGRTADDILADLRAGVAARG